MIRRLLMFLCVLPGIALAGTYTYSWNAVQIEGVEIPAATSRGILSTTIEIARLRAKIGYNYSGVTRTLDDIAAQLAREGATPGVHRRIAALKALIDQ